MVWVGLPRARSWQLCWQGKRGSKLEELLKDQKLFQLLSQDEERRYERLKAIWGRRSELESAIQDIPAIWRLWNSDGWLRDLAVRSSVKKFQKKHSKLLHDLPGLWKDVSGCWSAKGLHSSAELRGWLNRDDVLGDATFKSVLDDGYDLRIVAADVGQRRFWFIIGRPWRSN